MAMCTTLFARGMPWTLLSQPRTSRRLNGECCLVKLILAKLSTLCWKFQIFYLPCALINKNLYIYSQFNYTSLHESSFALCSCFKNRIRTLQLDDENRLLLIHEIFLYYSATLKMVSFLILPCWWRYCTEIRNWDTWGWLLLASWTLPALVSLSVPAGLWHHLVPDCCLFCTGKINIWFQTSRSNVLMDVCWTVKENNRNKLSFSVARLFQFWQELLD